MGRAHRSCGVPPDERDFLPGHFPHGFRQRLMQDARQPVVLAIYNGLTMLKCSASAAVTKRSISVCEFLRTF